MRDRSVPARAPLPADRDQDIRQRRVLDDNSAADRLLADQESDLGGRTNSRRLHGDLGDHGSRRAGWRVREFPSEAWPRGGRNALTGGAGRVPSGPPSGILAISVLQAAAAATSVSESAGQQQDYEDEKEDREHGHLPRLS